VQKDAKLEGTIETTQVLMLPLLRARLLWRSRNERKKELNADALPDNIWEQTEATATRLGPIPNLNCK
jgi:hypothetical protein